MVIVATVVLPFFGLIFCGYLAGRGRLIDEAATRGLNAFVYWFALPAMLLILVAKAPVREAFDLGFFGAYYGAGLAVYAAAALAGRVLFETRLGVQALQGMAASFPNVGYIGLPLSIAAFGEAAALPAVLIIVFDSLVLNTLTFLLLESDRRDRAGIGRSLGKLALGMLRNPLLLAIFAGLALAWFGVPLPEPVAAFGRLLSQAAAPAALFALGATLSGQAVAGDLKEALFVSAFKLYFHPLAVWIAVTQLAQFDPLWTKVALTQAALPTAASAFVVATQYGVYIRRASSAVFFSTAIAVFSVSALLAFLTGE